MPKASTTVLIAGASSGIGRAVARRVAASGRRVVLVARRTNELHDVIRTIVNGGGDADSVIGDVGDAEVCARAVALARERSKFTALVNCVGTNIRGRSLRDLTYESWSLLLRANLDPSYRLTQAALPAFREQGGGLIVHVASRSVHGADASGVAYQAAKAGVAALAHATAVEEQPHGIRVSVVYPGMTDTPLVLQRPTPPTADELARALQPEDVAQVIQVLLELPARAYVPDVSIYPVR